MLEDSEDPIGLLVLTVSLPYGKGQGALQVLREVSEKKDIPVLLVVSDVDEDIIERACAEGVTDFILRPFVSAIVRRRVENALTLHSRKLQSCQMADIINREREKDRFFSSLTHELEFEYTAKSNVLKLSEYGASFLCTDEVIENPQKSAAVRSFISSEDMEKLVSCIKSTTPDNPIVNIECNIHSDNQARWHRLVAQTLWSKTEPRSFLGVVGKAIDINDYREKQKELEHLASRDSLTGLLNRDSAKKQIVRRMENEPGEKYALVMLDIDYFKDANDNFGHSFGDDTLVHLARKITKCIRTGDTAARIGGDEFLIFMQYKNELEPIIRRVYSSLVGRFKQFDLSISMGVAESEKVGESYEHLLECADKALYSVKRSGKGNYCFYDESMVDAFSVSTPIESNRI